MTPGTLSAINRLLTKYFRQTPSPVVRFMEARSAAPFHVLVATILSARTKDQTTTAAVERLFKEVHSLEELDSIPPGKLETLIFPVGFYRTKARLLKKLPEAVTRLYGGIIPSTVEELVKLPGVGRKTANLVVTEAFDKPGICVDIHVHRISNRLGLLKTRTPAETEKVLREILPRKYWKTWNRNLVAFGQTLCLPRHPRCPDCPIHDFCRRIGV
ncbi:MAG: endonuclease III [bacterium]